MDSETEKMLSRGREMIDVVNHHGWKAVKEMLLEKVMELADVQNIDTTKTPTSIAQEIKVNNKVIKIILAWLQEVEGAANQQRYADDTLGKFKREIIITRLDWYEKNEIKQKACKKGSSKERQEEVEPWLGTIGFGAFL